MKIAVKIFKWLVVLTLLIYVFICGYLYFNQESILFHPTKLSTNYKYDFDANFEEKIIVGEDGTKLNSVLFKAENSKGLVFYLHGNAGDIRRCTQDAEVYTELGYDCFIIDYRGFGKSEGAILSQNQFFSDVTIAYDSIKKYYSEEDIIILGYSIGTGSAAMLAAKSNPKHLILLAPYYSITDMMGQQYPFIPGFLLEYKFNTCEFIPQVSAPVSIFHGDEDEIIYYGSSLKLKEKFNDKDQLVTLEGQKHGAMNVNPTYVEWFSNNF